MTVQENLPCPVCQIEDAIEITVHVTLDDVYNETDPVCLANDCKLSRAESMGLIDRACEQAGEDLMSAIADGAA